VRLSWGDRFDKSISHHILIDEIILAKSLIKAELTINNPSLGWN
jgi:hypothetical protein